MVDKISGLSPELVPKQSIKGSSKSDSGEGDFLSTLNGFMADVNNLQKQAGESINQLASGDVSNIHDVMVAVEKAAVSFELMMEIRNKVIEAYQEVMRTQL
ncbi:MAG: flagellar hook-basal body complex protein FliE [bacterium]|jgi:flagellar hook-basal body complex protein FliE